MAIQQVCHNESAAYIGLMSFGQRLKERREDVHLTGTELGRRLNPPVSKQTIAHWEGDRYRPQVEQLTQLCEILNISADALVRDVSGTPSPRAWSLAHAYDALSADARTTWDQILAAMPLPNTDKKSQIEKSGKEAGKPPKPLPQTEPTIPSPPRTNQRQEDDLSFFIVGGKGDENAGRKSKKPPKQGPGRGS